MKNTITKKVYCLVFFLIIMIPISVAAQNYLGVSPSEWNFGDVEIGSSSTAIFTLSNLDGADVDVDLIRLEPESSSFSITSDGPPGPITIPIGDEYEVIVEFSPSNLGVHYVALRFRTNAAIPDEVTIPIYGVGVTEEVPPSEIMVELIEYFNSSVDEGSIYGSGPGASASGRLKAFGNMLKSSSDLINAGEYESACVQLHDVLNRIDGEESPPDFVTDTTDELATMIENVLNELGCP